MAFYNKVQKLCFIISLNKFISFICEVISFLNMVLCLVPFTHTCDELPLGIFATQTYVIFELRLSTDLILFFFNKNIFFGFLCSRCFFCKTNVSFINYLDRNYPFEV